MFPRDLRDPAAGQRPAGDGASRAVPRAILLGLLLIAGPAFPHAPLDEQIADLNARIEHRPADASLYLRRGDLHRHRGERRAARADYRRARRIDPALAVVDLRLGASYLDASEPRRARTCLDRYLARRPHDPEGLRTRARALRDLGMPLAAAADLGLAIAATPPPRRPEPDLYLERARAFEAAGPDYLDAAIEALDEGMRTLGPIVSLQIPGIDLDLRAGRIEEALRRVDALEAIPGLREVWRTKRGAILERASPVKMTPYPGGDGEEP